MRLAAVPDMLAIAADNLVKALSPLKNAQIACAMTSFMHIGASKKGAATGMKLCPLPAVK